MTDKLTSERIKELRKLNDSLSRVSIYDVDDLLYAAESLMEARGVLAAILDRAKESSFSDDLECITKESSDMLQKIWRVI